MLSCGVGKANTTKTSVEVNIKANTTDNSVEVNIKLTL